MTHFIVVLVEGKSYKMNPHQRGLVYAISHIQSWLIRLQYLFRCSEGPDDKRFINNFITQWIFNSLLLETKCGLNHIQDCWQFLSKSLTHHQYSPLKISTPVLPLLVFKLYISLSYVSLCSNMMTFLPIITGEPIIWKCLWSVGICVAISIPLATWISLHSTYKGNQPVRYLLGHQRNEIH